MLGGTVRVHYDGWRTMPKAANSKAKRSRFHHGDLKNALLEAATRAVAEGGAEALSIRALAQELGVFHRAAYRHYADKNDLLAAVLTSGYQRLAARVHSAVERDVRSPDPAACFREIALAYAGFAFAEPHMFFALSGPRINESGTYPELETALQQAVAPTVEAIKSAQRAGILPQLDPDAAAVFFWASLQGVIAQILHKRLKVRTSLRNVLIEQTAERLFAGLQLELSARPGC
jgi:AcrR family transcriptional regulator